MRRKSSVDGKAGRELNTKQANDTVIETRLYRQSNDIQQAIATAILVHTKLFIYVGLRVIIYIESTTRLRGDSGKWLRADTFAHSSTFCHIPITVWFLFVACLTLTLTTTTTTMCLSFLTFLLAQL